MFANQSGAGSAGRTWPLIERDPLAEDVLRGEVQIAPLVWRKRFLPGLDRSDELGVSLRGAVFGTFAAMGSPVDNETDKSAIEALVAKFNDAWNRHDAHALAALFAEEADFTNVRGEHAGGRKAIEDMHAPLFAGFVFKDSHLTGELRSVRFLKADIAVADVDWEMMGAGGPGGVVRPPRKGLLDWVLVGAGGNWLIVVMHNTEFNSQPVPSQGR